MSRLPRRAPRRPALRARASTSGSSQHLLSESAVEHAVQAVRAQQQHVAGRERALREVDVHLSRAPRTLVSTLRIGCCAISAGLRLGSCARIVAAHESSTSAAPACRRAEQIDAAVADRSDGELVRRRRARRRWSCPCRRSRRCFRRRGTRGDWRGRWPCGGGCRRRTVSGRCRTARRSRCRSTEQLMKRGDGVDGQLRRDFARLCPPMPSATANSRNRDRRRTILVDLADPAGIGHTIGSNHEARSAAFSHRSGRPDACYPGPTSGGTVPTARCRSISVTGMPPQGCSSAYTTLKGCRSAWLPGKSESQHTSSLTRLTTSSYCPDGRSAGWPAGWRR